MTSLEIPILQWTCTFYDEKERRWKEGELQLNQTQVVIVFEDKRDKTKKAKVIKFQNISKITKEKSSYIYPSIVVNLSNCVVWLSSFKIRDEVFNNIEHFWRISLLDSRASKSEQKDRELLRIAYETQEVLIGASNQLQQQGRQLNSAARTMENMHNDITVAERITGDIESWFGAWRVKGRFENENTMNERMDSPLGSQSIDYPVLYGKVIQESHKSGQVVFKDNNFELLDEKLAVVYSIPLQQISEIDVHSPWDITILKRSLGKPLIRIHLTSARMPLILKNLQQSQGPELDLETLPQETKEVDFIEELGENKNDHATTSSSSSPTSTTSVLTKQKELAMDDAAELSKVLNKMKFLASDINVEQDAQLKQLDDLTEGVDRATSRFNATNRRIEDTMR
ncbi:synaptosomal-associated protein 47-like [Clytia hemisphaerica]|uniref:Synaptosomal-associated protein 47 n=1 Tax=Clytia hemisphaerica TaxID=252671 RepID=A0A7M5XGN8_9CNID|eukprot:TCONS_00011657-protein